MTWKDAAAPLRERSFAWYFASRFTNTLGSMMANIALAFAVLDIEGASASALGQVLAAHTIPMIVLLLWGGVISDRLPRTLVLQVSNVASALTQGAIAFLVITGTADLWMLIALSAVHGAVSAISFPAMASMVPQLVPRSQLQPANALLSLTRNGLTVLGPTIGALLVVTVGSGWALAIDAATWLLSAALLLPVRVAPRERKASSSTVAELREGWRFFWSTTWLWAVVIGFGALNMIHNGALFTLGPVVAQETIGRQGWGYVLSAEALGLLAMAVVLLRVPLRRPLFWGMLAIALAGLPMVVLGADPTLVALVASAFVAGAGIEVFSMGWNLAMQENIDDDMLSRAYSYDALGSFIAMPVGQLAWGPLGLAFGNSRVLVVSGIAYAAICLLVLCSRSVRDLPRRTSDVEVTAPAG
ncbi:MFS transporter [Nocardioides sp. Soil805]|uniref:MFS transporter n=1 Tax=Nocardioides sp. Soil805 TaxID=1736416 RepID=UPI00070360DF|nr:MFS transporter [Nocardioides sp. Soil805]KRF30643.1 MFS transporter [Nocardioides sp. Soil805]